MTRVLGHRRDVVMGPGRTWNIFESNKSIQKELGRDVKKVGGGVFQLVPGDSCSSETLINSAE